MESNEIQRRLPMLPGWKLQEKDVPGLVKEYTCGNFRSALRLVNQIGEAAELANHHPDIFLHDYQYVRIELSTHSLGSLSEADFSLAAEIEQLFTDITV